LLDLIPRCTGKPVHQVFVNTQGRLTFIDDESMVLVEFVVIGGFEVDRFHMMPQGDLPANDDFETA
jgi:hypothetical protein